MLNKKLDLLEEALGDFIQVGQEFLFYCPYCKHHKKKMSINIKKNAYKCWICGKSSKNVANVFYATKDYSLQDKYKNLLGIIDFSDEHIFDVFLNEKKEKKEIFLPNEFKTLTTKPNITMIEAFKYLRERGLTKLDIAKWKMGYCDSGEYKERIIIPSFDSDGNLNFFTSRTYNKNNWPPYKNPKINKDIIFNELSIDKNKPLTIVEGPFDAVVADNALPLLGSNLREESNIFQFIVANNHPKVYFALDYDARRREKKIMSMLLKYDKQPYKIDIPETHDVGAMTKSEFQLLKFNAYEINREILFFEQLNEI